MADWKSSRDTGSSPLTRGKHRHIERIGSDRRLIPAHAGKTFSQCSSALLSAAHPRSRGENGGGKVESTQGKGSSPLTRGKRVCLLNDLGQVRLIPAHAGKTPIFFSMAVWKSAHPRSRGENRAPPASGP